MKINSIEAHELLMDAKKKNDGRYIEHSICVGEAAARIAEKMNLDSDKARTLGYLHDIGKRYGQPFTSHVAKGYEYLISIGIDEEYANICLTHSYLNNDIDCTAGGIVDPQTYKYEFRKDFIKNHQYTWYEKIINLCDLICSNEFLTLEERLIDIMNRRGVDTNTQYHIEYAIKLKEEFDQILGISIYSLFPEIEERLFESKRKEQLCIRAKKNS